MPKVMTSTVRQEPDLVLRLFPGSRHYIFVRITITTSRGAQLAGIVLRLVGSTMRVAVMDSDDAVIFKFINGGWFCETGERVDIHFWPVATGDDLLERTLDEAETALAVGCRQWTCWV